MSIRPPHPERRRAVTKPKSNYDLLAKLEWLLTQTHNLEQWADDWAEGFPAGGDAGPQGKGGHSDRTSTAAITGMTDHRQDLVTGETYATTIPEREGHGLADQATQAINDIDEIRHLITRTANNVRRIRPMSEGAAQMRTRPEETTPGAGWCAVDACDRYCSGALNDKLVTGMCPSCYRSWVRRRHADPEASLTVYRKTYSPRTTTDVNMTGDDGEGAGSPTPDQTSALPFGQSGVARPHDAA